MSPLGLRRKMFWKSVRFLGWDTDQHLRPLWWVRHAGICSGEWRRQQGGQSAVGTKGALCPRWPLGVNSQGPQFKRVS